MIFSLRSLLQSLTFLLLCSLVATLPVQAETKVLTAEATYIMGDGESPSFAEAMVLQKAKQMALEQAGTYVESYTKVHNYDLTALEIQTIAGGVLQVEVLEKTRTLVGDGLRFYVKIKATVTTDKMEELAQRIKGKNVAEEYRKLQEDYARLNKEIETWKQLLAKTPAGPEHDAALDQIREKERAFAATQRNETAFFQRVVSGEELVAQALDVQQELDNIFKTFILQSQSVLIGQPKAYVVANSADLKIVVPVTLSVSDQLPLALDQATEKLGGYTWESSPRTGHKKTFVRVANETESQEYFLNRVRELALALDFHFMDGTTVSCSIRNDAQERYEYVTRLYPCSSYQGYPCESSETYLMINKTPFSFRATVMFPRQEVQSLKSVASRFFTAQKYWKLTDPCGIERE